MNISTPRQKYCLQNEWNNAESKLCNLRKRQINWIQFVIHIITGPPTQSDAGRQTSNGRRRLSSGGVRNATHMQGAARGGPVVLRPVRATPC